MSKLKRFCEKCGKELIYIKLPNGRMMTCEWKGPVPFCVCTEKYPGRNHYVTSNGKIICGITPPPDYISGYGHKVHMCEQ